MTYGSGTNISGNTATGNNNIDGLIANNRWALNTVTFSFTDNFYNDYEDEWGYPNSSVHAASFATLNAAQRTAAREWMQMYENVSGLRLIELTGINDRHATIRIAQSTHPGIIEAAAYAYLPGENVACGDVWFDRSEESPNLGNRLYRTIGHEIGHALGLKHGHEVGGVRNVAMNSDRDSMEFSIMTYRSYLGDNRPGYHNEIYGFAQSLMMYDIRAIQEMYGANFNYNSTDTTYTFSTSTGTMFINGVAQGQPGDNRIFRTIWDGNGNDTYNFANYTTNLLVDLTPGGWSDLDVGGYTQRADLGDGNYARGHVFNALQFNGDRRSLIENAVGGTGHDQLYGNLADNILLGNAGDDYLFGDIGDDTLLGGVGDDYLNGTSYFDEGTGEQDILTSGNLNDQDVFVLGERRNGVGRVFYNDQGNSDYAIITDFDVYDSFGDMADTIQLMGGTALYSLSQITLNGVMSTGIRYDGDLIGVVAGVSASSLNLFNSNHFTYV